MTVKQNNDKMFQVMKIDPNYSKIRSVTETEIVKQFDLGGCEVCGERHYGEPVPLQYPDCRTCSDKPSHHHGRCCPENSLTPTDAVEST